MAYAPQDPQTNIHEQDPAMLAAMNDEHQATFRDRMNRGATAAMLAGGAFLLAACGPGEASAEPHPATTTFASPEATGSTTSVTPEVTTSTAPESTSSVKPTDLPSTTTSPEKQTMSAELQKLADATTPEKLAKMTPEQLKEIFTIKPEQLEKGRFEQSYIEHVSVLYKAMLQAGFTDVDYDAKIGLKKYTQNVVDKYVTVAAQQLFGIAPENLKTTLAKPGDPTYGLPESPTTIITGTTFKYYFLHSLYADTSLPTRLPEDYATEIKLDESSVKVDEPGDGKNMLFSVHGNITYKEVHDFSDTLNQIGGPSIDPVTGKDMNKPTSWNARLSLGLVHYDDKLGGLIPTIATLVNND